VGAVIAIAAGVVGVTLTAPDGVPLEGERAALVAALVVLAGCTLVPYALARLRVERARPVGALTTFGAGAAYAFSGLTIPVLIAPLVGGSGWGSTPLGGSALAACLLVVSAGTAALAASSAIHPKVRPQRTAGSAAA